MGLYFGNYVTTVTTLLLIGLLSYMIVLVCRRNQITNWGRQMLLLLIWGLVICAKASERDGLHLTIQNAIDGSTSIGLFTLVSVPTVVGVIGAMLIVFSGIACIFVHKQTTRRALCYLCMFGIALKIVVVEVARILM